MHESELRAWYLAQSDHVRIAYLLRLLHAITVDFRYAKSSGEADQMAEMANRTNELMHHLTSYAANVLEGGLHRSHEDTIDGLIEFINQEKEQGRRSHMMGEAFRLPQLKLERG